jgi:SHS2 domain-containing protein
MDSEEKPYEIIDHTADIGLRVIAPTLSKLFAKAAYGLFDLMVDLGTVQDHRRESVSARADDVEGLLQSWLSELLYLYETEHIVFRRFEIVHIDETEIRAYAWGEPFRPERHQVFMQIKAVTYHGLSVRRASGGNMVAEVIFDI